MLNEIVNKLLEPTKYEQGKPLREVQLPFFDGEFKIQLWSNPYRDFWGVTIMNDSQMIGYKQFIGPTDVSPRMSDLSPSPGFQRYFYGFENHLSGFFPPMMKVSTNQALFLKEEFREKYQGIGKTIITASLEIMKRILQEQNKFRPKGSLFMTKECSTNIYYDYYQAKCATDYEGFQDVVIFSNATYPEFKIDRKVVFSPIQKSSPKIITRNIGINLSRRMLFGRNVSRGFFR